LKKEILQEKFGIEKTSNSIGKGNIPVLPKEAGIFSLKGN